MTKKYFRILFGVIAILLVLTVMFYRNEQDSITRDSRELLSGINSDQISKLLIEQGQSKVSIEQIGDTWSVVQRDNYPADLNKLRSLLLKLVDLKVSQKITSNPANFEKLGVADNSFQKDAKQGPLKISLLDSSSKEMGVVLLGEKKNRGGKKEYSTDTSPGQFIRRVGSNDVYLLSEPFEVNVSPEAMIATDLMSIPGIKVKRVLQEKISGGNKTKQFEMLSVKEADGKIRYDLDIEPNAKQEIQKPVVDSIASGLENVRIQDVQKETPELLKLFDQETTYELSTGGVYKVLTFIKDGKGYAKYETTFNQSLADITAKETENINEKKRAEYEQKKKEAEEKKTQAPSDFIPSKADIVSREDMSREGTKYSHWIFQFPSYQIEKYRRAESDLIKDKVDNSGVLQPPKSAS